jgi:hypothetical protein
MNRTVKLLCILLLGALAACGGSSGDKKDPAARKGTVVITGAANQN